MKVVVTGGTGFIGVPLVRALIDAGHAVTALVRDATRAAKTLPPQVTAVEADLETPGAWTSVLDGADALAHLAGEPIAAKRWDARQKQRIRDSRVESTRTLVEAIGSLPAERRPKTFVCASGVDYYAFAEGIDDFDDDVVTEADPPGESFLARVCRDWEKEARAAEAHGLRVVCLRTGMVLGAHGGALEKLATQFKLLAGGKIGNGRQFVSWISLDDAVGTYVAALTDDRYRGPINMITMSTRNGDFSRALGNALHKPSWLRVPGFAIKAAVGSELAESLLKGRNVVAAKLREYGFAYKHPQLDAALRAALA
jgi:hypothetical protein